MFDLTPQMLKVPESGGLPGSAKIRLYETVCNKCEGESFVVSKRCSNYLALRCRACDGMLQIRVGEPLVSVADGHGADVTRQYDGTLSASAPRNYSKTIRTTPSSTGDHMFTTTVVRVMDGYVGQVLTTLPGASETTIVYQTPSPFPRGERLETVARFDGEHKAHQDAQAAVAKAVERLFKK